MPAVSCVFSFCYIKGRERTGVAKIIGDHGESLLIEYFDFPGAHGRVTSEVSKVSVRRATLGRNTRIYTYNEYSDRWRVGRVLEDDGEGVLVRFAHHVDEYLSYEHVFVRWKLPISDPVGFLAQEIVETPMYAEARSGFLDSYIAQRGACQGMSALLSSSVELEAHQIDVVRRVLSDTSQRYLLADEVGLGKTIEAGIIIRQAVLDDPLGHRIVIIAPRTLMAQWRLELVRRFGLRDFIDDSIYILPCVPSRGLTEALQGATMLVIDEAHHVAAYTGKSQDEALYEIIRQAAVACPRLLLLSATPILRNESGFLRMLHLLDPVVYPLDGEAAFKIKINHRQALAETVAGLDPSQFYFLESTIDELLAKLPDDARLVVLAKELREVLARVSNEADDSLADALRQLKAHISETYRLNRRILRNRRRRVPGLTPERKGFTVWHTSASGVSRFEASLEAWRISANSNLHSDNLQARRAFAQFYFSVVSASLDDPGAIANLCKARLGEIAAGQVFSFEGESTLLAEIVAHCDPEYWLAERLVTLCVQLRQLPATTKAIIFCSSQFTADTVFTRLRTNGVSVVRHVASEEGEDLEAPLGWTSFISDPTVRAIVCDQLAEEGLNLQNGNKVLVHLDLPLQPNRIEQRIGRADRYGSGASVHSYAVVDPDSMVQRLWLGVLAEGWGIFDRSISSLQYIVEAELIGLPEMLFRDGCEALRDLQERLHGQNGLAATELRRIDQQDALDELAPVSEETIDSLLDVDFEWKEIQRAMQYWIADTLCFEKVPELVKGQVTDVPVRFQYCPPGKAGQATLIPLSGFLDDFMGAIDYAAPGGSSARPRSHIHTSHRKTAVNRGLRLLRYGDEFIEAIRSFSEIDDRGRSFAMWRQLYDDFDGRETQIYFRFDFLVQADLRSAEEVLNCDERAATTDADRAVLQRRADALFAPRVFHVWLDGDGDSIPSDFVAAYLAQPYAKEGGAGYVDKNLDQSHLHALRSSAPDMFGSWSQRCLRARDAAYTLVERDENLVDQIRIALTRARDQDANRYAQLMTRMQSLKGSEAEAERSQLAFEQKLNNALYTGIQVPSIQADVAGCVILSGNPVSMILPATVTAQ